MGCHPSHWRTQIFQDKNHQPVFLEGWRLSWRFQLDVSGWWSQGLSKETGWLGMGFSATKTKQQWHNDNDENETNNHWSRFRVQIRGFTSGTFLRMIMMWMRIRRRRRMMMTKTKRTLGTRRRKSRRTTKDEQWQVWPQCDSQHECVHWGKDGIQSENLGDQVARKWISKRSKNHGKLEVFSNQQMEPHLRITYRHWTINPYLGLVKPSNFGMSMGERVPWFYTWICTKVGWLYASSDWQTQCLIPLLISAEVCELLKTWLREHAMDRDLAAKEVQAVGGDPAS